MIKSLIAACLLLGATATAQAQSPQLYSPDGTYLGNLNNNQYDPNSVANPYGRYGSSHSPNSINNPYGRYGSPYSPYSARNPYATNPPYAQAPNSLGRRKSRY